MQFSDREVEVMKALLRGSSNAEIGAELYIGVETVKSHLSSIYRKLDVSSRGQAVARLTANPEIVYGEPPGLGSINVAEIPRGVRLELLGEFDLTTMERLDRALSEVLGTSPASVEFDMSQVSFFDSSALRSLVGFLRQADGVDVRTVAASPSVRRILSFAGLTDAFGLTE